jgi:hypothetical protein
MSYTRGEPYIWSDGEQLHLWSESGMDGWPQMEAYAGKPKASGVQIPEVVADEFAVMRVAELLAMGNLPNVIERALGKWSGNFGCRALEAHSQQLLKAIAS